MSALYGCISISTGHPYTNRSLRYLERYNSYNCGWICLCMWMVSVCVYVCVAVRMSWMIGIWNIVEWEWIIDHIERNKNKIMMTGLSFDLISEKGITLDEPIFVYGPLSPDRERIKKKTDIYMRGLQPIFSINDWSGLIWPTFGCCNSDSAMRRAGTIATTQKTKRKWGIRELFFSSLPFASIKIGQIIVQCELRSFWQCMQK